MNQAKNYFCTLGITLNKFNKISDLQSIISLLHIEPIYK